MHYILEYPLFLALLPLSLCVIYCKKNQDIFYIPKLEYIRKKSNFLNLFTLIKIAIFILLVLSLTSPIAYDFISPSKRNGRAIVLALDTSGSMRESGFDKTDKTKFDILLELVSDFIDKRVDDNIGIVAFGSFAFSPSPVTYDHQSLKELLNMLEVEIAGKNTAISDGIIQSIETLKVSNAKEKILILITDGMNNTGKSSINQAIQKAKEQNIKIYTIGLGEQKDYDYKLLTHISSQTMAKSFKAKNKDKLKEVYDEINSLYPSKLRSENYINKKALFIYPLFFALILSLWLLSKEEGLV
jgi:Ca-activated chloride channel family protein